MIHQFKKGDKVTVREGATSIRGHKTDPKEVRTVLTVWSGGRVGLTPVRAGAPGNVFEPEDLVPYVKAPVLMHPAAVKAGDTVRLDSDELVANVTGRVTDIQHDHGAWTIYLTLGVMGHSTPFVVGVGTSWRLTAHQPAPEPELPEGTIALIYGQKHVLIKRGRTLIAHADRHSGDPMVEGIGKDAGLNNKMLWVNIERGWAFNEYRSPLQTEASTPQVVYNPDASVVIDPAEVDVEALLRAYAKGYAEGLSSEPRRDGLRAVLERLGLAK